MIWQKEKNKIIRKYNKLEKVPCNLCGGSDTKIIWKIERFGTGLPAVMCKHCGLIYLNPRWTQESLSKFYEEDYRKLMGEEINQPEDDFYKGLIHGSRILDFTANYIGYRKKVLDIGCAVGSVLWVFRKFLQSDVYGVEPTLKHQLFCQNKLGIKVLGGTIEDADFKSQKFDLVILTQTLNHLSNPLLVLKKIKEILSSGGLLFIEVQNFPECAKVMTFPIQLDHLYYFTFQTLEALTRQSGFILIKAEEDTKISHDNLSYYMTSRVAPLHIRMLFKKSEFPIGPPRYSVEEIIEELKGSLLGYKKFFKISKSYLAIIYKKLKYR